MAGQASGRRGPLRPAPGLQALAELINDALAALGAQPAFLGPLLVRQSAIESTPLAHRPAGTVRSRVAQAGRSESSGALPPDADSGSDTDSDTHSDSNTQLQAVEETHAETWRLVHLAQAGDGEAFGQLYDRYMDVVFRFIYFRVNDRALAEDFTSETFLRALRRIGTISYQGRDIGAWFITIARNIVLDHMKSARHRLEVTTADTLEGKEQAESTEDAVLNVLQSERLMQAIAQLGDEQRECVMLRFLHGLSVSETAHVMGKNDGAIKALQHRAVRKLADLVGGDLR
jgi:RNA polymerase sigma-70 factor (TIGR02952 family)